MKTRFVAPKVPIASYKRTKIIATVGPSTLDYKSILGLVKSGANGLRLNFSHGTHEQHAQSIKHIRKAQDEYRKPLSIIQDLQGPKIRLGDCEGVINVEKGQSLTFKYKSNYEETGHIPIQYDLSKKVKRGENMYLYDGKVRVRVTSVKNSIIHCRAENNGILIKRKGINLPDTDFGGDIITEKDKRDIAFGSTQDIDYVALSFVQTADDINQLRKILRNLGSQAKIIAKIETKSAVENLEEIVEASDAVMVARGDLALETEPESVPVVQRKIIGLGRKHSKPTIVATQMLASMTETPEPTRAEVSDVANAVVVGADSVMLSDETASGKYPIDAVKVMKRVIIYTQNHMPMVSDDYQEYESGSSAQNAISNAILGIADDVKAKVIVAETRSGATPMVISSRRPNQPIIAVTSEVRVAQQLAIAFDVKSFVRPISKHAAGRLSDWLYKEKVLKKGDIVVSVSGRYPGVIGTTDTIKVRMVD